MIHALNEIKKKKKDAEDYKAESECMACLSLILRESTVRLSFQKPLRT